ncbi:UDP-N-acetylglucosamine-N-acetylmuramyl-(pentapeptide) pyrophosphoryl-undecaprenol N-acetylglucosamine transferase [gamma proteobacterium HdN1]|nr:UDP-N-acetylglucosamine-N-acetylmuramyl-(pentapeptide) pyrophosphoryl-undecaprenol N-acetylglucosamine transferase [gamma proteobacterium HdN1]
MEEIGKAGIARVLIMAGGTGGHVFPALAAARYLEKQGATVQWLGTRAGIESRVVPEAGIAIHYLDVAGVRGQGVVRLLKAPFKILRAVLSVMGILRKFRPDFVLGLGGFVTGPGGVAARLAGTPLFIHEQNAIPGFTNRMLSKISSRTFQAFPNAFSENVRAVTTGNPVRAEIAAIADPELRWQGRTGPIRLLVVGGSQGAVALNQLLPRAFPLLAHQDFEIFHQAGQHNAEATEMLYREAGVQATVVPFINDMAERYAWADFVICRSGALTVSEIAAVGIGALLIPYPFAVDDHQTKNAEFLVNGHAAHLAQQNVLTPALLAELITKHFSSRAALKTMAIASRKLAKPEATQELIDACKEALRG